jgi:hypothetical protein
MRTVYRNIAGDPEEKRSLLRVSVVLKTECAYVSLRKMK